MAHHCCHAKSPLPQVFATAVALSGCAAGCLCFLPRRRRAGGDADRLGTNEGEDGADHDGDDVHGGDGVDESVASGRGDGDVEREGEQSKLKLPVYPTAHARGLLRSSVSDSGGPAIAAKLTLGGIAATAVGHPATPGTGASAASTALSIAAASSAASALLEPHRCTLVHTALAAMGTAAMTWPSDRDTGVKPSITSPTGVPSLFGFAVNFSEFRK